MTQLATTHYGLIFTPENVERARANRDELPFNPAWVWLDSIQPPTDLDAALIDGLRYRLNDDDDAGGRGAGRLAQIGFPAESMPVLERAKELFALAQTFELTRDFALTPSAWLNAYVSAVDALNPEADDIIGGLWRGVAQVAAGVIADDAARFEAGVAVFKHIIDTEIHPEGHFRTAVKVDPEAQSLTNQIDGAAALVLIAEMADHIRTHTGVDLWRYENRGISVFTAASYTMYYYFYPEQWRWNGSEYRPSEGVKAAVSKPLFRDNAGFVEIVAGRYEKPLKAASLVLRDLRPIYNGRGGGLVTLTHAIPEPKKRKRRFGLW